jgi:hypothetical protein
VWYFSRFSTGIRVGTGCGREYPGIFFDGKLCIVLNVFPKYTQTLNASSVRDVKSSDTC